ncbi:MAG: DegV family protein [Chloroflexi bacterium]|nr:DegV family protein [Chloroflexota bacterium]
MIGSTAIVVDSGCYLPQEIIDRHGLIVVPLSIEMDGDVYAETDLDPDDFYRRLPAAKSVTTSQPSPALLTQAYERAASEGAEHILSIHIGSNLSGTVNAANLAAADSPVPVTVVDTRTASMAEGLCILEAIEALADGASPAEAARAAGEAGPRIGNTFIVRALDLPRRGGRLKDDSAAGDGVHVMVASGDGMQVVGSAASVEDAVDIMAAQIEAFAAAASGPLRVGVGHGAAPGIAAELKRRLDAMQGIGDIIEYVVGPAVGVHTGPGNAGAVYISR